MDIPPDVFGLCKKALLIRGCLPSQMKLGNILSRELTFVLDMNTEKFLKRYMNLGIMIILSKLIRSANDNVHQCSKSCLHLSIQGEKLSLFKS